MTCRICQEEKSLTEDHVPPRAITGGAPMMRRDMADYLQNPNVAKGLIKQNGVKFKTICGDCNSLMGQKYDPEITKLAKFVNLGWGEFGKNYNLSIKLNTSKIIRAVLGHMVASKAQTYSSTFDNFVRNYFFDETALLPDNVHIYYWMYPHKTTVILRDTAIGWIGHDVTFCHILKFHPLGFLITQDEEIPKNCKVPKLSDLGINTDTSLNIPPIIQKHGWPEHPEDDRFVLGGESFTKGTIAVPRD